MAKKWKLLHRTLKLESRWVTVYVDKLLDDKQKELEYWHYDRPDSVVSIVLQGDKFVMPAPQYRVGVDEVMLDFVGSRVDGGQDPKDVVFKVLERELGVNRNEIKSIKSITNHSLAVDSSFSSQRLHGYVIDINETTELSKGVKIFDTAKADYLRSQLRCAQCLLLLDEYLMQKS